MERGEGSHGYRSNSKSSFESGSKCKKEQARLVREQDQYMPIANVIRIMRRILPPYAKISDDAKETIQECVSEYISFITSEANERCHREQRKTITAEDVLWAMSRLGFDNYVHPLTLFLNRYRHSESDRTSVNRREPSVNLGPPPPPPPNYGLPSFPMGLGLGLGLGPSHHGMFDAATLAAITELSNYYSDAASRAASSSSSHNPTLPNFDPFAEFK